MPESTEIDGPAKTAQALSMSTMNALSLLQGEDYQQDYDEDADNRQQRYARVVEVMRETMEVAQRFADIANNPMFRTIMACAGPVFMVFSVVSIFLPK
jgi:hypothetical protein